MKVSFTIYIWSIGIYSLLTLPAMVLPIMYMMSIFYVLIYGWFAWAVFTIIYLTGDRTIANYISRMILLFIAVPVSVAFSFQMLEVFKVEENVWNSGSFLLFPLAATVSGWISLFTAKKKVQFHGLSYPKPFVNDTAR